MAKKSNKKYAAKGLVTEDVVKEYKKYAALGMTKSAVCERMGISNASLQYHLGKAGVMKNQWTKRAGGAATKPKNTRTTPTVHTFEVPEPTDSTEGIAVILKGTPQFLTDAIRSINA